MNKVFLTAIALCFSSLQATAMDWNACILAGDSQMLGFTDSTSYQPMAVDSLIPTYHEVGQLADTLMPDLTKNEYPPATAGGNLARWLQTVPREAHSLSPVPIDGSNRAGLDINFGRYMYYAKTSAYHLSILKFAFGGTALTTHWTSAPFNLTARLIMFLSQVQLKVAQEGDNLKVKCLVIYLGTNDIWLPGSGNVFQDSMEQLIYNIRWYVGDFTLPVVLIKPYVLAQDTNTEYWKMRYAIENIKISDQCVGVTYVDDLIPADGGLAHYNPITYNTIGQRVANVMYGVMNRSSTCGLQLRR